MSSLPSDVNSAVGIVKALSIVSYLSRALSLSVAELITFSIVEPLGVSP